MRKVGRHVAPFILLALVAGCGTKSTTTKAGGVTTTVVQDSQWVTALISAGAVLISSALAAWTAHYFTARTEKTRQAHAEKQEDSKRRHEARLAEEQRVREQVIATATAISKMLHDFRAKAGEAADALNVQAADLYDECDKIVRKHHDEALPVIEVMPDFDLRQRANKVFEIHGLWAAEMTAAIVNGTAQPDADGLDDSRERFYRHARTVIKNAAA
ncbi:hypothetical protein [Streptomyces sp. B3I8]|uniref:hypothetical protein n=1 Tax=Streptomyces sp. B3I8 TaxID=3042303 RepID=UPI00277D8B13|nr:hypothetical protein [Streptomyces sp. B3I8]MDQ0789195.1 hypothetical protein [Streptomyces sp. B3I8]